MDFEFEDFVDWLWKLAEIQNRRIEHFFMCLAEAEEKVGVVRPHPVVAKIAETERERKKQILFSEREKSKGAKKRRPITFKNVGSRKADRPRH